MKAPTLATACAALPPEGVNLPWGGPAASCKPGAQMQLAQRQANDELVAYVAKEQICDFTELMQNLVAPMAVLLPRSFFRSGWRTW